MGRYPTVDEEAGDELVIDLAAKHFKKRERPSWRLLAKRMVSRHRHRGLLWAAARAEKKPCRGVLPRSPTVRSASRKTRPLSPSSPPWSKAVVAPRELWPARG